MWESFIKKTKVLHALKNTDGVAAIEFAIIAPVMIAMYMGLAEVSLLITADRNVSHAASVLGDLSTQLETLNAQDVQDVMNATLATLAVSTTEDDQVSMDITSYFLDDDNQIVTAGYAEYGSGYTDEFDTSTLSDRLINSTSGLLVARVKYNYHSPSTTFVKNVELEEVFMFKPRKSATIAIGGTNSSIVTCTRSSINNQPRANCS